MSGKTILFSLLGTTLDKRYGEKRWNTWRPSVAICQHDDLLIDSYHLIYPEKHQRLMELVRDDIKMISPETEVFPHELHYKDPWDFEEVYSGLLDFLKQFSFTSEKNNYLFHITTGTHVAQICTFLLTESHIFPGKLIQTGPSFRQDKVAGSYTIIDLDLSKYDKIVSRFEKEHQNDISLLKSGIDTKNKAFNELIEEIEEVSRKTKDPVLLTGPTGAGKSHLARQIYELKKNHSLLAGKYIEVNCATLKGQQALSTLFGHTKGAFTGATADRGGILKSCDKGLVFLDEIGELGLEEQAMLLKALEEKKFMPLGSDKEITSDFQMILGTNRNLNAEVEKGTFREDLFSRINLWSFKLPGLTERIEDIEPNIQYELNRFYRDTGKKIRFNKDALINFLNFSKSDAAKWSANFRDLCGSVKRMCTFAIGGRITLENMKKEKLRLLDRWQTQGDNIINNECPAMVPAEIWQKLDLFEQNQLSSVLQVLQNSRSLAEAGRKLFSVSRKQKKISNDSDRLRKYLAKYQVSWKDEK